MRNEEVLLRVNEQRNILREIRKRKANWIGHILCTNCLLHVIEGKIKGQIEVTRRRGRRHKKLLDDLKDRRGYCQLKEEALVPVQGCTLPLPNSRAIPLLPLWAVRPVQSLSACTRVHFSFT